MNKRQARKAALDLVVQGIQHLMENGEIYDAFPDSFSEDDKNKVIDEVARIRDQLEIKLDRFFASKQA